MEDLCKKGRDGCLGLAGQAAKWLGLIIALFVILAGAAILLAVAAVIIAVGIPLMVVVIAFLIVASIVLQLGGSLVEYFRAWWRTMSKALKEAYEKAKKQPQPEKREGLGHPVLETVSVDDEIG